MTKYLTIEELKKKSFNYDYEGYFIEKLNEDIFAELILNECITICKNNYVNSIGSYASAHNSAIQKCINEIETIKKSIKK